MPTLDPPSCPGLTAPAMTAPKTANRPPWYLTPAVGPGTTKKNRRGGGACPQG
ncbi:MAG: hypothetical protein ACK5QX_04320 [bacterium]